jgi:hypothetical protein
MKNSVRLKGFSQEVLSREWIDYVHKDGKIHLTGSFMEERII